MLCLFQAVPTLSYTLALPVRRDGFSPAKWIPHVTGLAILGWDELGLTWGMRGVEEMLARGSPAQCAQGAQEPQSGGILVFGAGRSTWL